MYGLDSKGTLPAGGVGLVSLPERLAGLLDFAAPGLREARDLEVAHALLAGILAGGGGAGRQRACYRTRGSLAAVVDELAEQTTAV
jgi:carboxylate-amine ligase